MAATINFDLEKQTWPSDLPLIMSRHITSRARSVDRDEAAETVSVHLAGKDYV
jgi:hypothetical protein